MAPSNDSILSSPKGPPAPTRVQDGRVEKSKGRKGDSKPPNYSIDGRTFACQSCKKGHRVSKCTHALERPVHMTNDPGRPSSDQKRHCDCPKQCSCAKKNCKCARNCVCTQTMYVLVHVPFEKQVDATRSTAGKWQIGRTVTTDLQGNQLTEEEIQERAKLKSMQKPELGEIKVESPTDPSSSNLTPSFSSIVANWKPGSKESTPPKSCCQHKKAIEETGALRGDQDLKPSRTTDRPRCNCGPNCSCAFCLDHPDNPTSRRIAKEQAAHFVQQGFTGGVANWQPNSNSQLSFPDISCMGTNPKFAMHSQPNPSPAELQGLFGGIASAEQGYYLSYPITGPSWASPFDPSPSLSADILQISLGNEANIFYDENAAMVNPITSDIGHHAGFMSTQTPLQNYINSSAGHLTLPFQPHISATPMQIGNASVSLSQVVDGMGKWHDPSLMWTSPEAARWPANLFDEQLFQEMPDVHPSSPLSIIDLPVSSNAEEFTQRPLSSPDVPTILPGERELQFQQFEIQYSSNEAEQARQSRTCCQSLDGPPNPSSDLSESILHVQSPRSSQAV